MDDPSEPRCTARISGQDTRCGRFSISPGLGLLQGALGASLSVVLLNCALREAVDFVSLYGTLCVGLSGLNLLKRVTKNQPTPWDGWAPSSVPGVR